MPGRVAPATHIADVSPSDSTDLTALTRALWVGGAGDLKVTTSNGETVVIPSVPAGTLLPIAVKRVWSGSTTATLIQAWW